MALCHDVTDDLEAPVPFGPKGRYDNYAEMVAAMDKQIGRLVTAVNELGLREKTLILFTTDNGTAKRSIITAEGGKLIREDVISRLGEVMVPGGKTELTDGGTRVPTIANWPGTIAEGTLLGDPDRFQRHFPHAGGAWWSRTPIRCLPARQELCSGTPRRARNRSKVGLLRAPGAELGSKPRLEAIPGRAAFPHGLRQPGAASCRRRGSGRRRRRQTESGVGPAESLRNPGRSDRLLAAQRFALRPITFPLSSRSKGSDRLESSRPRSDETFPTTTILWGCPTALMASWISPVKMFPVMATSDVPSSRIPVAWMSAGHSAS